MERLFFLSSPTKYGIAFKRFELPVSEQFKCDSMILQLDNGGFFI